MIKNNYAGFTLPQLIITLSVVLILAASVVFWLDPLARIGDAKDKRRKNDIAMIADALSDYSKDHKGRLPILGVVNTYKKVLCASQSGSNLSCDGTSQLCLTVDDDFYKYLGQLPVDPDKTSTADTGYYLIKDDDGTLEVGACDTYGSDEISLDTRIEVNCARYGGGYCWYKASSYNLDCDAVCAGLGLNCVDNFRYGADVDSNNDLFCMLNKSFVVNCQTTCSAAATSTPPRISSAGENCTAQLQSSTCYTPVGASYYALCACE